LPCIIIDQGVKETLVTEIPYKEINLLKKSIIKLQYINKIFSKGGSLFMKPNQEVFERLRRVLAKSLDVEETEISIESRLFEDFKVESVEVLDLTFRIEQEFGFTMVEGEFWNIAELIANGGLFKNGFSDEAINLIKENFSISDDVIKSLTSPFDIYKYITIGDLVNYIAKKIS
jgi:acyl carrier protein